MASLALQDDRDWHWTYSSIGSAERLELGLGVVLEHLLGDGAGGNETLHGLDGDVPDLLVLLLQQENNTGGLGVERARDVEDGGLNNGLDSIVGDGALSLETIVGTAGLNQLEESVGGGVLEFDLSGAHCDGVDEY